MKQFKLLNSVVGWITFLIASAVYLLTIEPTASFWDCGEFISTAFKLEVGHPPGAALFMILGNFFTNFAGGDVTKVSVMVNVMSALASSFTILFLFWSITHLAKKLVIKNEEYTLGNTLAVIGAGLVGALAYTFSDTFWFSAVEGEVYASSSLFTAVVFWAILKWESHADEKHANRWLVLIAYLMGLSIGVHLLNLLAIPAIVFVYYFKKYPVTTKGIITTFILSVVLLALVMYGVIQGLVVVASYFELMFVNGFGLPYTSGVFFYVILVIGLIIWGLIYSYKKGKVLLNTSLLFLSVLIIGYSSVAMIVIRSSADTPLDENDPDNMFSLLSYINREQYGDRPLLYGNTYNAPVEGYEEEGKPTYTPINGRYEVTNRKVEYKYDPQFMMFFPRMYSADPDHVKAYESWGKVKGVPIASQNNKGEPVTINKPTFSENLRFFFSYQINHMYIRYFMWNFAGRQNDIQGHGEVTKGNWISGFKAFDEARLGPQDNQPESLSKNKARNKYYFLPLLLGLIGLFYQYKKGKRDFSVVMLLFFMTGIAILLYLNQTPYQPRERDYAYAGSFYAFTIWIGLGVIALYDLLSNKMPAVARAGIVTVACLAAVPAIMANENWDDHDRSGRYTARDFAINYLNSCEPNAIIFTNGDNDTFPLWYAQEVEGVRTDVRVINLSYLSADWYVEQMHIKAYNSDPIPFKLTREQVLQGKRDIIYLVPDPRFKTVELKQAMEFVSSDNPETKKLPNYPERIDYIPAKSFTLNVDSAEVFANNYMPAKYKGKIDSKIEWTINKNYLTKADLMILDLLANNNWKRPVYFAITVAHENYLNLDNYLQIHGLTYKVVPIRTETQYGDISNIDTKVVYDNVMNKFKWGGVNNPKVYLDENNLRMLSNFRNTFSKLAEALINENKNDSALKVLERCEEVMPDKCVPYNYFSMPLIDLYYRLNKTDKADAMTNRLGSIAESEIGYIYRLQVMDRTPLDNELRMNLRILQQLGAIAKNYGRAELAQKYDGMFQKYYTLYTNGQ